MRRAVLLLLLVPALAGCTQGGGGVSTSDFSGDERDVADAVAEFSEFATRSEESQACDQALTEALQATIAEGGENCGSELAKAFDDADSAPIEIDDVTVSGTTATAEVLVDEGDEPVRSTFALVEEDGDWRIDSFGGGGAS